MPKSGGSDSSSSSSTSSSSEDNKVSATDNAIALGKDSSFNYNDEFSDNVREAYGELVGLARDAGLTAIAFAEKAIQANQQSVQVVSDRATKAEELSTLKDNVIFNKVIPYAGIALIAFVLTGFKKGKK